MREQFDYIKAKNLQDAFAAMKGCPDGYVLYAGGTDIIAQLRAGKRSASLLIDVKDIPELNGISAEGGLVVIGSATTHSEIQASSLLRRMYPALCSAAGHVGSVPIRNKATIGGNIQNASPAADCTIGALGLDASLRICSPNGCRELPLVDFFTGPGHTSLEKGELITSVTLPQREWTYQGFFKTGRRNALAISIVNGSVAADMNSDGVITDCRIALGAVAKTPLRMRRAEGLLTGSVLSDESISGAVQCVMDDISPISDIRASAEYRKYIAGINVKKQLESMREAL